MRNKTVIKIDNQIALIPYCEHHVLTYHNWMSDPKMLQWTASEALTIDEEYEMQHTWTQDRDKLTFILLDLNKWNHHQLLNDHQLDVILSRDEKKRALDTLETKCIFGDVNLFLETDDNGQRVAEVSIMVALQNYRRHGYATKILKHLFAYGHKELDLEIVRAKINLDNEPSRCLFQDKLNFVETSRSAAFNEVTLTRELDEMLAAEGANISHVLDDYSQFRRTKLRAAISKRH